MGQLIDTCTQAVACRYSSHVARLTGELSNMSYHTARAFPLTPFEVPPRGQTTMEDMKFPSLGWSPICPPWWSVLVVVIQTCLLSHDEDLYNILATTVMYVGWCDVT